MRISRHKGTEADQSHNYTIDVTRGELKDIAEGLGHYSDKEYGEVAQRLGSMKKELQKYIE